MNPGNQEAVMRNFSFPTLFILFFLSIIVTTATVSTVALLSLIILMLPFYIGKTYGVAYGLLVAAAMLAAAMAVFETKYQRDLQSRKDQLNGR